MSVIHNAGRDYTASRGEYLNAKILAKYLDFEFIDAREIIFFNENGQLDCDKTYTIMGERLKNVTHAVIPGFYGSMPNDTIRTFSRGGSDITGAIVARSTNSVIYENWTDVSGVLMADPRNILRILCDAVNPDSVFIEDEIALIAVVGRGMRSAKGTAARTIGAIAKADINLVMIDQGSSELNIILGVKENDLEAAIEAIYNEFRHK